MKKVHIGFVQKEGTDFRVLRANKCGSSLFSCLVYRHIVQISSILCIGRNADIEYLMAVKGEKVKGGRFCAHLLENLIVFEENK